MDDPLQRELIYFQFYFNTQLDQIAIYWVLGILIGSAISVFGQRWIHTFSVAMQKKNCGVLSLVLASLLGIASPLCMYGTIPIAASFSQKGIKDDWLAAFMMSSILLNPQLLIYTLALGNTAFSIRFFSCLLCGVIAGIGVRIAYKNKGFFNFTGFGDPVCRDIDPNLFLRYLKNVWRNVRATGGYFLLGIILSALFQQYVPPEFIANIFGDQRGFGVLLAATIGVPLYVCGGGTIPLLMEWLQSGMSMGAAAAFMITGPATKITNLGAVKIILGAKNFTIYILYVWIFAVISGVLINAFM
ncbi:permease [uncultured Methanospirillum sp.]|uniref:permease n=1 Tax=uncultured Methanospirillum sp. TaxID=262503 RepID=UPI0029C99D50|nr:permease [uncultured Methanospirillum sp.]